MCGLRAERRRVRVRAKGRGRACVRGACKSTKEQMPTQGEYSNPSSPCVYSVLWDAKNAPPRRAPIPWDRHAARRRVLELTDERGLLRSDERVVELVNKSSHQKAETQ